MSDSPIDRTQLTFAQAEGFEEIPSRLEPKRLDKRIRAQLWDIIYSSMEQRASWNPGYKIIKDPWRSILKSYHVEFFHEPSDLFSDRFDHNIEQLRTLFFEGEYWQILNFLQHLIQITGLRNPTAHKIKGVLENSLSAYIVIEEGPTIVPISSHEEKEALERAFSSLKGDKFAGARSHLVRACEALNGNLSADSVRESIHAVEATAKILDDNASKTLTASLKTLTAKANIHKNLQQGFLSLYGYANDEKGIRHALLEDEAKVDDIDATFMLGACASFISYLINKSRKAGLV